MAAVQKLHNSKWGESHITVQWERSTLASPRGKQGKDGTSYKDKFGNETFLSQCIITCIIQFLDVAVRQDLGSRMTSYSVHVKCLPATTTEVLCFMNYFIFTEVGTCDS